MGKLAVPGYTFPRIPEKWAGSEHQFALALRNLFDLIFSDQETQDRTAAKNAAAITALDSRVTDEIKAVNDRLDAVDETLEELDDRINDTNSRIDGIYDELYPIGITVLTDSGTDAPFTFGTWEVLLDGNDDPQQDDFGHYMWKRVNEE